MQSENPILDQLAKLMTNAAGAAKGVRDEIGTMIKTQAERIVNDLDLVPREEFDAMKALALRTRMEVEELRARLAGIESNGAQSASFNSKRPARNLRNRKVSPRSKYRR
jgi:BMFP domain-containing protein YqiC